MEPESSSAQQKSTGRTEQSPSRKSSQVEAGPSAGRSTVAYHPGQLQPCFSGALPVPAHQQVLAPDQTEHSSSYSSYEQVHHGSPQLLQQPMASAFMASVKPELGLEGRSWQLFDPRGPMVSAPFHPSGLHPHRHLLPSRSPIVAKEEPQPVQPVHGHHSGQVPLKADELPRKDKKPQKPGKYICQFCSRPCAKPSVLQKHIRSHTGERPYPCHSCSFSFKTKSNLYKHRKSHAHKLKAGLVPGSMGEPYPGTSGLDAEKLSGDEPEEQTEGDESTDSEDETVGMPPGHSLDPPSKHKHIPGCGSFGPPEASPRQPAFTLAQPGEPSSLSSLDEGCHLSESSSLDLSYSHKPDDSHTIKQRLALRLSERRKALAADEQTQTFLSPGGSKGSTESGYFSRSESAEQQQLSPPQASAKSYAEIILGKYGRYGQRTAMIAASATHSGLRLPPPAMEDKPSGLSFSLPKAQMEQNVIEHITKLITINEAVVDTRQIDSVKPRRTSLSRRGSIESPKPGTSRDSFHFDPKQALCPEASRLAHRGHTGLTETVPLTRSNSMPSAGTSCTAPAAFKGSHSFDDRTTEPDQAFSQGLITHHRMLKRQKAIELPSGMEYQAVEEEWGEEGKERPGVGEEHGEAEAKPTRRAKKGPRVKGLMYECDICGARYRKRTNYETHKKFYCSELHAPRTRPRPQPQPPALPALGGPQSELRPPGPELQPQPQIVHYKLRPSLELTPARKRRKEKSLGDDEEPPYGVGPKPQSAVGPAPGPPAPSPGLPLIAIEAAADARIRPMVTAAEGRPPSSTPASDGAKRTTGKEISVIQHTNTLGRPGSFEAAPPLDAAEHLVALSSQEAEYSGRVVVEAEERRPWQPPPRPHHHHHHHPLQARLVRQRKIQVPEILVTEEPEKVEEKKKKEEEAPATAAAKEPEKPPPEEFQWPQRSQTLSQFPTEKLPPKKKRLRLADMSQSSGESSFESAPPLSRSPSQESSLSRGSSLSASFEREGDGGVEAQAQVRPSGPHMLTVPAHYQQQREMRRSSSEQASSSSSSSAAHQPPPEARSKSFDYGSLSSDAGPGVRLLSPAWERRRCLLVRQTSLCGSTDPGPDPPPPLPPRPDKAELGPVARYRSPPPPAPRPCPPRDPPPHCEAHRPFPAPAFQEGPHYPPRYLSAFGPQQQQGPMSALLSAPEGMLAPLQPPPPTLPYPLYPLPHPVAPELPARPSPLLPLTPTPAQPPTYLPARSQLAFQLQAGGRFRDRKPPFHPLPEYSPSPSFPPPTITHSPEPLRPTVSLVVPVRVQEHLPTYGSAMYTTLSQMLVTQSADSSTTVVICRVEDSRPKATLVCSAGVHGIGLDLAQMFAGHHRDFFPSPYLRVPLPMAERTGCLMLGSTTEGTYAAETYPSTIGGSKRMLSPAGSLELTMETQQQKRVKEEEIEEESEEKAEARTEEALRRHSPQPSRRCQAETKVSAVQTSSPPLTSSLQPPGTSGKHEHWSGHLFRGKTSLGPVKKEDHLEVIQERSPVPLQEFQTLPSGTLPDRPSSASPAKPAAVPCTDAGDAHRLLHFPSLHTTTNVSWCYLKYTKPNPSQHTDPRSSVYASWCISLHNPNLPGMSTKLSLALLRSKQMSGKEIYTMATAPRRQMGKLVPSSARKLRVSEMHIPSVHSADDGKEVCKVEKEEERRKKHEDDSSTPKRLEPTRIKIFDGGYKSNEDYVYVRGRGRGKYVCEECGIRCKKPSMLKKHIRTHTDLRPYACNYCNFAFKTKGNLTKHMKSKAHSKKCQEMGVTVALMEDLESEEGTSEEPTKIAEESEGTDLAEDHQFSDVEESDDDDDNEDDDEEEEEEEPFVKSSETASASPQTAGSSRGETSLSSLETASKQGSSLTSQYSLMSYPMSSSQLRATESPVVPACHSISQSQQIGSTPMPLLPSAEHFPSGHGDPALKRHSIPSATISPSIDPSPWSPKREASRLCPGSDSPSGRRSSPAREATLKERPSSLKDTSPPRHLSPGRELSPRRCLSPDRGMSPRKHLSPGREVSSSRCLSPRIEVSAGRVSPRAHLSPEREVFPGRTLSSSIKTLPVRCLSPAGDVSPTRRLSLRHQSPVKDELPSRCHTPVWQSSHSSSAPPQHIGSPLLGLPQRKSSKEQEQSEVKMKMSGMGFRSLHEQPTTPSQALHFCLSRNTQTALEGQSYSGLTGSVQDYVFSHLPLHSQQLVRTPYPMIPIGGIQMVQSRPGCHSGLVPSQASLQPGFPVSLSASSPFSASRSEATVHIEEEVLPKSTSAEAATSEPLPVQLPSAPTAPLITAPSPSRSGKQSVALQRTETAELKEAALYKQEEYRVPIHTEPSTIAALSRSGKEAGSDRLDSPSASREQTPKSSTSSEGTSKDPSTTQFGCPDTYYESARTLAALHPPQGSSGSSSSESVSPTHTFQTSAGRTTPGGQCPPVRMQMGSSPESKGEGFKHPDAQKDDKT
ncbi:transcription factor HIVEP3 isoform X1 [Amblyraja radiata]|uniref:transcription factor HIVEP3 isoform X1 n=1 Tax=Amblyraja radiata TaxID=386614 RepID=UPI00140304EB|nr:transcription factor HIVEP3 isoform X1 [Amblyraja radiata]XP_032900894.1 transcription factor HIVEP3 isoform X1 [Amblyraja radiata]